MIAAFNVKAQNTADKTKQDNGMVNLNQPNLFIYYLSDGGRQGVAGTGMNFALGNSADSAPTRVQIGVANTGYKFSEHVSDTTDNATVLVGASDLGARYYIKQ